MSICHMANKKQRTVTYQVKNVTEQKLQTVRPSGINFTSTTKRTEHKQKGDTCDQDYRCILTFQS